MKREIQFRGKRVANNEWIYGSYAQVLDIDRNPSIIPFGDNRFFGVIPETVGQFINRHDINDKPVYESDNLKCKDLYTGLEFTGTVEFQDCSFVIKNDCVTHYRWMDYEVEVVGNVWESGEKGG